MIDKPSSAVPRQTQRTGLWLLFVGVGALVVALSQTILIPILSVLPVELNTTTDVVQWLLTITLLVGGISVPLLGRLGDMFGTRRMLLVAVGAMAAGSLVTAVASDIPVLLIGRGIQGIGAGAIPLGISLLAKILPKEKSATGIAVVSAMLGVGGALGLPLAGLIAENFDFHVLFWITGIAGVLAFLGILLMVPESPSLNGGRIDYAGAVLLSGALVTLLLPLSQGSKWGWDSFAVLGLFLVSIVFFVALVLWQGRIDYPLVDIKTLRRRPIALTNVASLLFGFALFASLIGTASYVQAPEATGYGFGSSIVVGGLVMLPSGLCMLIFAPIAAKIISSRGAHQTLAIGAFVVALGWLMRIVFTGSLLEIIIGSTVVGIGTSIGYASMPALINVYSPPAELASSNSVNALLRTLGSSLASAVGGAVLVSSTVLVAGQAIPSLSAYRVLFALCAAASLAAVVIALFIPGKRPVASTPTPALSTVD